MKGRRVTVEATASSANLGCGFDTFALALARPRDRLTLERADSKFTLEVGGAPGLVKEPSKNLVAAVAAEMMRKYRLRGGLSMKLMKGVPVGLGLGSSAASSVAAAVGVDSLFGLGLSEREIIAHAGFGEKVASGTAHYDNVAASFAGGFTVVNWDHSFVSMEPPRSMALCLVTPRVKLPREKTKFARSLLPKQVRLERAVAVTRAASMMVHGFSAGNLDEIGDAMAVSVVDDRRGSMVPGFERVRLAALSSGASGACISGAGPTLLAVAEWRLREKVTRGMVRAFRSEGIGSNGFATRAGTGCRILAA